MKYSKVISALILGIFLISFASAVVTYGEWQDGSQSMTINQGESAEFEAGAYISMNPPIIYTVKLYDAQYNLIQTLEDTISSTDSFFVSHTITGMEAGTYLIIISGSDSINTQSYTLYLTVNPVDDEEEEEEDDEPEDITDPVIILTGNNPQTIVQGTSYIELGATATDDVDGDLTSSITIDSSAVDTSTIGLYLVTYSVSDTAGNSITESRLVNVIEDDEDDEDEDDEEEDNDEDDNDYDNNTRHTHETDYPQEDEYDKFLYFHQFQPETIYVHMDEEESTLSWFQKLINTIVAFFKWIFRLE